MIEEDLCFDRKDCQIVLDENSEIFMGCTDKVKEADSTQAKDQSVDESHHGSNESAGNGNSGAGSSDEEIICGNNKILICHVPPGNPAAAHTICIARQGWINGHSQHHDGDHEGACLSHEIE